jgi:hypothetical protein
MSMNKITETAEQIKAQKKQEGGDSAWRKPKTEKVPLQLALDKMSSPKLLDPPAKLGKGVVVIIGDGTHWRQITVHRPIGQTGLAADDWVATPTSEIQSFLAMAGDPSAQKKAAAVKKAETDYCLSKKFYENDKEKGLLLVLTDGKKMPFQGVADQAKKDWETARDIALEEYLADCRRNERIPKKDWKFGQSVEHYYDSTFKARQEEIKKLLAADDAWKAVKTGLTPQYVTLGGPNGTQRQSRIGFKEPYETSQVVDKLHQHLMNSLGGGYIIPAPPSKALISAWGPEISPEDAAKQIAAKLIFNPPVQQTGGVSTGAAAAGSKADGSTP